MVRSRSRKSGQDAVGIGLEARSKLCAVALDTNATDGGHPNISKLKTLAARLNNIGIPLWVPEPVAWEWAEHTGKQWEELTARASQAYKRVLTAGVALPPISFTRPSREIQEQVLDAIRNIDNVVVVPLSDANAREGLRDQILQRPPGRLKDAVKTGASDSAWLRDLRDRAGGDLPRILLVSSDKDVAAACAEWDIESPLLRTWEQLLPTLFDFVLDDGDATVTRLMIAFLRNWLDETGPGAESAFTMTADPAQLERLAEENTIGYGWDGPVTSAELTELTALAGITNVTIQEPDLDTPPQKAMNVGVTHSARATVFFLGNVDVLYRHDGRPMSTKIKDVVVRAEMSFEIRDGGAVVSTESLSDALVDRTDCYDESEYALNEVTEMLSVIPQLGFPTEWPDGETYLELRGPGGEDVVAELEGRQWGDWTLTITIGADPAKAAAISCARAEEAPLYWRVLEDPENVGWTEPEPPFALSVDEGPLSHSNPGGSLAAWTFAALVYEPPAADDPQHEEDAPE